jgi:hypothetical protein
LFNKRLNKYKEFQSIGEDFKKEFGKVSKESGLFFKYRFYFLTVKLAKKAIG